jgi:60 kDa SS-A/Ro ribonucleoprotein
MVKNAYGQFASSLRHTSQSEAAKPEQVRNRAGGYVFQVDAASAIDRFLLLGTDKPTYYASSQEMTQENAKAVIAYASDPTTGLALVSRIVEISEAGRAPKNSPAIFALAIAGSVGDPETQRAAWLALPKVCRTATHLFEFYEYLNSMRGWGRAPSRAVQDWYLDKRADQIAYQAVKYRQRNGWTHRDILRHRKPVPLNPEQDKVFGWAAEKYKGDFSDLPKVIQGFEKAKTVTTGKAAAALVTEYNLPWEALPDAVINTPEVWEALVPNMGMTALMRNLSRVARLPKGREAIERVMIQRLSDDEVVQKARLHPINILTAMRTYASGSSQIGYGYDARRGSNWTPNSRVVDVLDKAFYASFGYLEPTGKRHLIALDVSGSMGALVKPGLSARDVSVAMAMSILASGDECDVIAFTASGRGHFDSAMRVVDVSMRRRLDDNVKTISGLPFGGTDCALPALWAKAQGKDYDAIEIFTDNESWAGRVHPFQALRDYRQTVGHRVAQIVTALTATNYSVADPSDPDSLDVVGFDSALPNLISSFVQ